MNPTHESRMPIADGIGKDVLHEIFMHYSQVGWRGWNWSTKSVAYIVGDRLPDWAIADVLNITYDVVEHPVGLRTKALPIHRIEGAGKPKRVICGHFGMPVAVIHGCCCSRGSRRHVGRGVRGVASGLSGSRTITTKTPLRLADHRGPAARRQSY
jgi:hypothetical protein